MEAASGAGRYRVSHVYRDGPADKEWIDVNVGFTAQVSGNLTSLVSRTVPAKPFNKPGALTSRIAVLEGGEIVELGSHDELVAAHGRYAELYRTWEQQVA